MHLQCVRLLTALILLIALCAQADSCSTLTGPAGELACIWISRYSGMQYATCLTNKYIQLKSGGKHFCQSTYATYCYYQCMIEVHDSNQGAVTPDCSCSDATGVTPTPFTGTTLPPTCYSPSGEDCSWYTDCLERKIACGTETGYALAFGKVYCELYTANYMKFSELGRQWVDAVRKCLQVSLVPLIRQYYHPTCDEVKTTAISYHTGCYLSPYTGKPGICAVLFNDCRDALQVFYTVKGAFVTKDMKQLGGIFSQVGQVISSCQFELFTCYINATISIYEGKVEWLKNTFGRRKRSTELQPDEIAAAFATALSNSLGWKALGIEWIPLTANVTGAGTVSFRLMIGDQREFDLNKNYSQPMDMRAEMQRLETFVQNGKAQYSLSDGQFYMRQLSECGNTNCTVKKSTTTVPAEPSGADVTRVLWWLVAVLVCAASGSVSFD